MTGDVLEEAEGGLALAEDSGDAGPEVSWVSGTQPLAGRRKRLTRVAANHEIHAASKSASVEGVHVRPDRRPIQARFFHRRNQSCDGERFPLHIACCASPSSSRGTDSEVEPSDAGAEREDCEGMYNHVIPHPVATRASCRGPLCAAWRPYRAASRHPRESSCRSAAARSPQRTPCTADAQRP